MLNVEKLKNLPNFAQNQREFNQNVKLIFEDLKNITGLKPDHNQIEFSIKTFKIDESDPFSIGVHRILENHKITIFIHEKFIKFTPFIVLRELYNLFVPKEIRFSESIQLIINQILLTDLSTLPNNYEWRKLIRGKLKHYHYLVTGFNYLIAYDRLEKFFEMSLKNPSLNFVNFFFEYVRDSKLEDQSHLIQYLLEQFTDFPSKIENKDEFVETLRCILSIFYREKKFKNIITYKEFFQKYKKQNLLDTSLSIRKFTKNLRQMHNNSMLAPSYQLQYKSINLDVISLNLEFNSFLNNVKILDALMGLPFFITPKYYFDGFSLNIYGYVILPKSYIKDFLELFEKLKHFNYIRRYQALEINNVKHCVNLNYFRESAQNQRLIDPSSQNYEKKYEIEFTTDYGANLTERKLELLDFLIFDRIRSFSYFGFGFEKRAKTLATLKSDLINEIITQRTMIKELKESIELFHKKPLLKKKLINFIDSNRKAGFFHAKKKIENYYQAIKNLEINLTKDNQKKSFSKFNQILIGDYHHFDLLQKRILKLDYIETDVIKNIFPSYFNSKDSYLQIKKSFEDYSKLFNAFFNLKMFNLNDIRKVILNKDIMNSIFDVKEEKLKNDYEKYRLYKINGELIDGKINQYLTFKPAIIKPLLLNTIMADQYVHNFLELIFVKEHIDESKLEELKVLFPRTISLETKDFIDNEVYLLVELSVPFLDNKEKRLLISYIHTLFQESLINARFYIWTGMTTAFSTKNFYDFEKGIYFYTKDLFKQYYKYLRSNFGEVSKIDDYVDKNYKNFLFSNKVLISELINSINSKIKQSNLTLNSKNIRDLMEFHLKLKEVLLNDSEFKNFRLKQFYDQTIDHIHFIPAFHKFGITQNYVYLKTPIPSSEEIGRNLGQNLQKFQISLAIESANSFLISYIKNPNSENNFKNQICKMEEIQDFCHFQVKNVSFLFDFDSNIKDDEWNYKRDYFLVHIKNVLSGEDLRALKKFKLFEEYPPIKFDSHTKEFRELRKIYNWTPIDIKSFLLTKKARTIKIIQSFVEKGLVIPYLTLKGLALRDSIYFIIPSVKLKDIIRIKGIFQFFNYGFIYEIKGEYKIGIQNELEKFENGLYIKLLLPKCKISDFVQLIDLVLEDMEILNYVVLVNLIDSSELLKK